MKPFDSFCGISPREYPTLYGKIFSQNLRIIALNRVLLFVCVCSVQAQVLFIESCWLDSTELCFETLYVNKCKNLGMLDVAFLIVFGL